MTDYLARDAFGDLDWNLLRTFVVIVDEGSITRGANRLMRTQPTISSALKRLEDQVGRRLVERGGGRFALTEHGAVLYRESRKVLDTLGQLGGLLSDADQDVAGAIRIATVSYVVFPPFDELLGRFHRRYPAVTFTLDVMPSVEVIRTVRNGLCSFGICLLSHQQRRLNTSVLFREQFGFFCGSSHPLFGRRDVTMDEMRDSTYVSFKTDQLSDALHPVADLRRSHQLGEEPTGVSSNLEEVRRMIMAGMGIGSLPVHAMERDVRDGRLWQLPPYVDLPAVDVHLVTNDRTRLDRGEQILLTMIRDYIESVDPSERSFPQSD
ncbi:LysR family transcriptional regulator [Pelagibius sp.]|uniref:LysR family transcriptional regulator n=1 Tax=Pelagibius sp. TaxID=1931238 RepID=UPI003BAECF79